MTSALVLPPLRHDLEPEHGWGREHLRALTRHLLEQWLQHIDVADPYQPPTSPIAYPHPDRPERGIAAARYEGIARTFVFAALLIADEPDLHLHGQHLGRLYAGWYRRVTDPRDAWFVAMDQRDGEPRQPTCEAAATVAGLWFAGDALWQSWDAPLRAAIVRHCQEVAHGPTMGQNWRWFSLLAGAFAAEHGADIDREVMQHHLDNVLGWDAGQGWYRDSLKFDYYSPWAFQTYAPLWIQRHGARHFPAHAQALAERQRLLMATYPRCFDRDGRSLMWGRSAIYRCAACAPLAATFFLDRTPIDPGLARHLCLGNIRQFFVEHDILRAGTPCLGFYRPDDAILQTYSCTASPFWLGNGFWCLALPATHPFWTTPYRDRFWSDLGADTRSLHLPGPGLVAVNHGGDGTTELLPHKVPGGPFNSANYNRLAYHSHFLWQPPTPCGISSLGVAVRMAHTGTAWLVPGERRDAGTTDGIHYAQIAVPENRSVLDLAVIPIACGLIHVWRWRLDIAMDVQLGSHALPHLDDAVHEQLFSGDGWQARQLVGRHGAIAAITHTPGTLRRSDADGLHPLGGASSVIGLHRSARRYEHLAAQVVVWRHERHGRGWNADDITPIRSCEHLALAPSGSPQGVRLALRDGRLLTVDFAAGEGCAAT